jgi:ATP-dependent Clp protease ATP-binding subunit ClpA
MIDRFTDRAKRVMQHANKAAERFHHEYIGTEDILLGLVEERVGVFASVLENMQLDLNTIRTEVEKFIQPVPDGCDPPTARAKAVIEYAMDEAKSLNHDYVGTEHLLLGLLREQDGLAARVLLNLGLSLNAVREEVVRLLGIPIQPTKPGDGIRRSAGAWADMPEIDEIFKEIERERKAATFRDEPQFQDDPLYGRCTDRTWKVLQLANEEAKRLNHEYVGTEHILLGLLNEGAGIAAIALKKLDLNLDRMRFEVEKTAPARPDIVTSANLPQSPKAKKVVEHAVEEAKNLSHRYVGTEHLLLGLLREQTSAAAQVLMELGLKLDDVRQQVLSNLGMSPKHDA